MIKQTGLAAVLIALLLTLTACSPGGKSSSEISSDQMPSVQSAPSTPDPAQPEGTAKLALDALQDLDAETLQGYLESGGAASSSDEIVQAVERFLEGENRALAEALTENLTVELGQVQTEGDQATVKASFTNRDLSGLVGQLAMKQLQGGLKTQQDLLAVVSDVVAKAEGTSVTTEATLQLERQDGEWKLLLDEAWLNAASGNAMGAMAGMLDTMLGSLGN